MAAVLIAWDIYNAEVAYEMGMAWDMGPPVWPYQIPEVLLQGLFFPAYVIAIPIFWCFDLFVASERDPVLLLCALLWWHLVGRRLDFGVIPGPRKRFAWWRAGLAAVATLSLVWAGVQSALVGLRWWWEYNQGILSEQTILLFPSLGRCAWLLLLAAWMELVTSSLLGWRAADTS